MKISCNPPAPRKGLSGSWDRFVGPGATQAEEWLQLLGGYRSTGYLAHMETDDFRRGIAMLEELAIRKLTAYMCAEVKSYRCHRRHVSDVIEQRGWCVIHVIDQNRAEPHTEKHNVIKCD